MPVCSSWRTNSTWKTRTRWRGSNDMSYIETVYYRINLNYISSYHIDPFSWYKTSKPTSYDIRYIFWLGHSLFDWLRTTTTTIFSRDIDALPRYAMSILTICLRYQDHGWMTVVTYPEHDNTPMIPGSSNPSSKASNRVKARDRMPVVQSLRSDPSRPFRHWTSHCCWCVLLGYTLYSSSARRHRLLAYFRVLCFPVPYIPILLSHHLISVSHAAEHLWSHANTWTLCSLDHNAVAVTLKASQFCVTGPRTIHSSTQKTLDSATISWLVPFFLCDAVE